MKHPGAVLLVVLATLLLLSSATPLSPGRNMYDGPPLPSNLRVFTTLSRAVVAAAQTGRPILVLAMRSHCPLSQDIAEQIGTSPAFQRILSTRFILLALGDSNDISAALAPDGYYTPRAMFFTQGGTMMSVANPSGPATARYRHFYSSLSHIVTGVREVLMTVAPPLNAEALPDADNEEAMESSVSRVKELQSLLRRKQEGQPPVDKMADEGSEVRGAQRQIAQPVVRKTAESAVKHQGTQAPPPKHLPPETAANAASAPSHPALDASLSQVPSDPEPYEPLNTATSTPDAPATTGPQSAEAGRPLSAKAAERFRKYGQWLEKQRAHHAEANERERLFKRGFVEMLGVACGVFLGLAAFYYLRPDQAMAVATRLRTQWLRKFGGRRGHDVATRLRHARPEPTCALPQ